MGNGIHMLTAVLRRAVGILDAAATPHGVDRYLELVAPTWSTSEVRGRVTGVTRPTADTVTLTIEANRNWTGFDAGQYVAVSVEIDGVRHTRCYSPTQAAADPRRRHLELAVKATGLVSTYLYRHAKPGLVLGLSLAQGHFTLPSTRPDRLLLVSGGSGITPVLSMLRTLSAEHHDRPVTFLHYCLTPADLVYGSELAAIERTSPNVDVVRVFTSAPGTSDLPAGLDGFVTPEQLDAAAPYWRDAEAYVCGPSPLMDSFRQIYEAHGISSHLHTEAFTLTEIGAETGDVLGRLTLSRSNTRIESDGRPILEQAEAAGLTPVFGCRMGICHTCVCPLTNGAVRDLMTGEITDTPGEDIRICVSAPIGDTTVEL
jgi:stearoyl-CoA 9-desaturase NADPH oxidoreductase